MCEHFIYIIYMVLDSLFFILILNCLGEFSTSNSCIKTTLCPNKFV